MFDILLFNERSPKPESLISVSHEVHYKCFYCSLVFSRKLTQAARIFCYWKGAWRVMVTTKTIQHRIAVMPRNMFVLTVMLDTVIWLTVIDLCWLHWREKQNGWICMKVFLRSQFGTLNLHFQYCLYGICCSEFVALPILCVGVWIFLNDVL